MFGTEARRIVQAAGLMILLFPCGLRAAPFSERLPSAGDDSDTWLRMTPELSYPTQTTSMVLSDAQLPMLCYKPTYWQGCSVLFAEYDGDQWNESEVDCEQYSGSGGLFLSPDGEPVILYGNSYHNEYRYAWRDGDQWSWEAFWSPTAGGIDGAFDSSGCFHTMFVGDAGTVYYGIRDTTGAWSFEEVGPCTNTPVALCLDSLGMPHAVWQNDYNLHHYWLTGSGWESEPIMGEYLEELALEFDGQGVLHLVFQGASDIVYCRRTAGGWENEVVDDMSGLYCDLAVADDGTVHVAYNDGLNYDLRYAKRTLSGWWTEVVTWEGSCGHSPSIDLDGLGNPWMCHSRFDSCEVVWWGEDTSAVAHRQSPVTPPGGISGIAPNPMSSGGMVHLSIPEYGRYTMTLYDLSGRVAARPLDSVLDAGSLQVAVDASSLPTGTYIAALRGEGRHWCSRMVVIR